MGGITQFFVKYTVEGGLLNNLDCVVISFKMKFLFQWFVNILKMQVT